MKCFCLQFHPFIIIVRAKKLIEKLRVTDLPANWIKSQSSEEMRQLTFQFCRRGGVHSLLSGRRSRSVSASPPIQKENPFRQEFLGEFHTKSSERQFQKTQKLPLLPLKCVSLLIQMILNFDTFQKILAVKLNRVLVRNQSINSTNKKITTHQWTQPSPLRP